MMRQTDVSFNSSSSFNSSLHLSIKSCFSNRNAVFIITGFSGASILLLPLFILVLYVGYQRWRKQSSTTSHSDIFTFNMVAMELIAILGACFFCCATYTHVPTLQVVGVYMLSITAPGQTMFHNLTCVERYLAVVHPITYRGLRQAGGVRIRNISVGCVWLLCLAGMGVFEEIVRNFTSVSSTSFWIISSVSISFFSLSVLSALIRPRPGDGERVDQSKQRAFTTIMAILGALMLKCLGYLASTVIYAVSALTHNSKCALLMSVPFFSLPSSLVLPLLFLHRAGKLPGCKRNTGSE